MILAHIAILYSVIPRYPYLNHFSINTQVFSNFQKVVSGLINLIFLCAFNTVFALVCINLASLALNTSLFDHTYLSNLASKTTGPFHSLTC